VGEQSGGVGQFVDEGQVVVGEGCGVFDGPQFGFEGGFLVVAAAELLGEPLADGVADRVGLPGELADFGGDAGDGGVGLLELAFQGLGAGVVEVVLLSLAGRDEFGQPGGAVVAESVGVKEW
jgi:hypothetical protein